MHTLASQFKSALGAIEIKDDRRRYASEAHTEIREFLEADKTLCGWGVQTALIGSYARHTGIWPGKDVDVFTKLTKLTIDETDPQTIFESVAKILTDAYDDRAEPQSRSVKINFSRAGFEFSVDVVPAVRWGSRWAIPRWDTTTWDEPGQERWVETDPEQLATLTEDMNSGLKVGGQGAYVPVVKLVRQTRSHHRSDSKPGGFYFELLAYWAFSDGLTASSFAEIFSNTLHSITTQLRSGVPLKDPVLGTDYRPTPDAPDLADSAQVFAELSEKAEEARTTDDICRAGALWREILGRNENGWCFPVPDGCDEYGRKLSVTAPAVSRGSREPGSFA